MDKVFMLSSGVELKVSSAAFVDANRLKNALLSAARGMKGLDDSLVGGLGGIANMDLGPVLDAILGAATSPEVEQALFKCAERALYDNIRVNVALFDDPQIGEKARGDYYEIALKIIEVNCRPFFSGALSRFKDLIPKKQSIPA